MSNKFEYPLLEDVDELEKLNVWTREVYQDFLSCRQGEMSEKQFTDKYQSRKAIINLDMTKFTRSAIENGALNSLLRIFDVQKVCTPVFKEYGAVHIRAFADDLYVLFDDPRKALEASLEVHRRIGLFNSSGLSLDNPAECCIGIGYGDVFSIGPDRAMGDEMNRSSKLGEDTARGGETLITENTYQAVKDMSGCVFEKMESAELPFVYYAVRSL
ncbi:MAG: hypothetical protein OEZ59_08220 [Deltaproteobacteria bacterium]|nr:hypothetical protein [Deltaproteobacteria bacterium]